jgi:hypothetical protein
VISIESNEYWYGRMQNRLPANCRLIFSPVVAGSKPLDSPEHWCAAVDAPGKYKSLEQLERYVGVLDSLGEFDVVVIDGEQTNLTRLRCVHRALDHLRPGGLVIVDNSDWLPASCRYLREADFIEIDFCGLAPLNPYTGSTSLFLRRDARLRPVSSQHPGHIPGGYEFDWEPEDEARQVLMQLDNAAARATLHR